MLRIISLCTIFKWLQHHLFGEGRSPRIREERRRIHPNHSAWANQDCIPP